MTVRTPVVGRCSLTRRVVLINASGDTFTPTRSGSLGPWVWEVCRAAKRVSDVSPYVVTKRSSAKPFEWPELSEVDWPRLPRGGWANLIMRANRKLLGWSEFGLGLFARRVAIALQDAGLSEATFFLQNDPELTVYLRKRFPKCRIVCHFQNEHRAYPRFRRGVAHAADVVTACSSWTARAIDQLYGLPMGTTIPLHSGVDSERFSPALEPRENPVPVIGFIGRVGPEKGLHILLQAAAHIARSTQEFAIQLIGVSSLSGQDMGPYQLQIADQISHLISLGIQVRQLGFLDRWALPERVCEADIHVVPSTWDEPFGLVTLEGMACGVATVASRVGGIPEIVGDAGFLFERGNADELARHLLLLLSDGNLRAEMGQRARQRAQQFTWDRTWHQMLPLLDPNYRANDLVKCQ